MNSKYHVNSTSSFQDINQSYLNRSKSKQTYSFSKSHRFQTIQPNCPINTYDNNTLNKKNSGISIGKSRRSDFTQNKTLSPGVSKYNLKSLFDENSRKTKGYSIKMSRENISFGSYLNKQLISIPPPTRYNYDKKQRIKSPSYTLRSKTKILDKSNTIQPQNSNPGPGSYENPQINLNSKYTSKFSNIGYSNSRMKRFNRNENCVPGPGNYKEVSSLSKIGGTKAIFDHQKRVSKFQQIQIQSKQKPGPGSYRLPSEFGHYDSQVYQNTKTLNTSRYSKRVGSKKN